MRSEVRFSLGRGDVDLLFASLMFAFSIGAALFLLLIGEDALRSNHPFQFFADSITYIATYEGNLETSEGKLVGVDSNYLGPLTLLRLLGGNNYLVMFVNVFMFTHSVIHVCKLLNLNSLRVGTLLLLSPITISSLLAVNKEIFIFPFIAFALDGYMRRRVVSVLIALGFSILVRWQLMGFSIMIFGISRIRVVKSRMLVLLVVLFGISAVYLAISEIITPILAYVENSIDTYDEGGSGLFEAVLDYQNKGLYFLVFPVKALHLLFGMGLKINKIFFPSAIYNDFFVGGHCLVALVVFIKLLRKKLLSLDSDLVFLSLLFLVVFCITPVFAPRYLFLVFVLWVFVLEGAPVNLPRRPKPRSILRFLSMVETQAMPRHPGDAN